MHNPLFQLGPLSIHPFGAAAALGIIIGYIVALWLAARQRLTLSYLPGIACIVILGEFCCARALFVLQHPTSAPGIQGFLQLWRGGLSLPGGLIGGTLLLYLITWARRESFWSWADALAPATALGLAVGMLGLPYGGEGWGEPTTGQIFMRVSPANVPLTLINNSHFQPVFAYEAVFFAFLALLVGGFAWRHQRERRRATGVPALIFLGSTLLFYGLLRPMTLDYNETGVALQTQALCALGVASCVYILIRRQRREKQQSTETTEILHIQRAVKPVAHV